MNDAILQRDRKLVLKKKELKETPFWYIVDGFLIFMFYFFADLLPDSSELF